ncbi:hypothetical protein KIPE111705_40195 [Kibdelosporangium persicum]|nr:hypothetical protein [Kibdelosporangium persicum]
MNEPVVVDVVPGSELAVRDARGEWLVLPVGGPRGPVAAIFGAEEGK